MLSWQPRKDTDGREKRKMIKTCYMRFPVFTMELLGHVFFIFYFGC